METNTAEIKRSVEFDDFRENILHNIEDPAELEKLYRKNKAVFQRVFNTLYTDLRHNTIAQVWNERLNYQQNEFYPGSRKDLLFVVLASVMAGLIANIPDLSGMNKEFFFSRNIGFIVFPVLIGYFSWKQKTALRISVSQLVVILASVCYINLLPDHPQSDTLILACIHLPVFLWTVLGYSFVGGKLSDNQKKIDFLRFNGDFAVMTAILVLSGILFTGITFGLFEMIGLHIQEFYAQHILAWGLATIPVLSTFLVQTNPQLVNKISPLIARIFTPIVFVTLFVFLCTIIYTGKNVYHDRNFLLMFNGLLIAVMAIILFSVSEATKNTGNRINLFFLFGLSLLSIVVNSIALSAIAFRLTEFGISPNRLAVSGANLLIFINLLGVTYQLLRALQNKADVQKVENVIARFLPLYGIWAALITFLLPLIFGFK